KFRFGFEAKRLARKFTQKDSSIAGETSAEFLSKATGTAVDWVQMPRMKLCQLVICDIFLLEACWSLSLFCFEFFGQIIEILNDRPSWFQDCWSLEVFTMFPAGNGGTIELVYTQIYAPTRLAPSLDFWTLRYTTSLDNGSLVVCISLNFSGLLHLCGHFSLKALRYIRQIAQETSGEVVYGLGRQPAVLRTSSQRLSR
ncbi:hypothetical protein C3L33_22468, partial [Rhododendron williamsianum]